MITAFFRDFRIVSEDDIPQVIQLFTIRKLKKGDYFALKNEKINEVAFI